MFLPVEKQGLFCDGVADLSSAICVGQPFFWMAFTFFEKR